MGLYALFFFALGYVMVGVCALTAVLLAVTLPAAAFYLVGDVVRAVTGYRPRSTE